MWISFGFTKIMVAILKPIAYFKDVHCWSYNYFFDFTKACIVSSPISTSHLIFYEAFYILKNSNNLVNDLSSMPSISDAWILLVKIFPTVFYLFHFIIYIFIYFFYWMFYSMFYFICLFIYLFLFHFLHYLNLI